MTRDLHLIRHAKSSWNEPHLADHDRPLNARGRRAAPLIGRAMALQVHESPRFFVSTARRARDTFSGLCDGWPQLKKASMSETSALYTFSWETLSDWLGECDDSLYNLAIIGHNPAMTDLINYLCPDLALDNLPTAGWVWLRFEASSWSEAVSKPSGAKAIESLRPKALMGEAR